jgi:hypothetical protein
LQKVETKVGFEQQKITDQEQDNEYKTSESHAMKEVGEVNRKR